MNIPVDDLKSGDHFRFRGHDYVCVVNVRKDGQEIAIVTAIDLEVANQYSLMLLCRGQLVRLLKKTDSFTVKRREPLPRELTKAVQRRTHAICDGQHARASGHRGQLSSVGYLGVGRGRRRHP